MCNRTPARGTRRGEGACRQQMYRAEMSSWNLRDRHMAATLDVLAEHLERQFGHAKVVVWEHNSHVGDAVPRRWDHEAS